MDENSKQENTSNGSTKRKPETSNEPDEIQDIEKEEKPSIRSRLGPKKTDDEQSDDSKDKPRPRKMQKKELETDPVVIAKREKQIEYGKNTNGYENYIRTVPKSERSMDDPRTPPKHGKYSRRAWDGLIKQWRIKLHKYDVEEL
ncbi:unnamed protein product [Ceutorhynchus assimilis]|uniref:Histone RNA hairpin-binding protein RNA-binding domain-containing protein n=1 Tax=Ceutorhynchus assimilis TaxID=467358 RepID=A0A9N9QNA3_9CUCU|nr:unnamed protein product [Ceutorhynchus assimilis]